MTDSHHAVADQQDRVRALDIGHSVIVQAPAGSGKTELLAQRFLKLLALVDHPEEVLAITFTRKAAGEMRERLLDALSAGLGDCVDEAPHKILTWRLARAVLERDAALDWQLLAHPSRLRIMTIDALNASLTRQMPLLARVGASMDVSDTPLMLYEEAADAALAQMLEPGADGEAAQKLVARLDNLVPRAASLLASMLGKREQWLRHLLPRDRAEGVREAMRRSLTQLVEGELQALAALLSPETLASLQAHGRTCARILGEAGRDSEISALACEGPLAPRVQDLPAWKGLAELLLTGKELWRQRWDIRQGFSSAACKARKAEMAELVATLAQSEILRAGLARVRRLPAPASIDEDWDALSAFMHALPLAAAQLELVFRSRGRVDYPAVARAALDALGRPESPTDLALVLDYRIRHILVDEFQDTSATQFELLTRLTAGWAPGDGRTLFCVGDPMQSIYRFREAEVALFLRAWQEGIGDVRMRPVELSVNFRSTAGIVNWVNESFPAIMPGSADLRTAAVPFKRSVPNLAADEGEAVRIHGLPGADAAAEAATVAALVAAERAKDPRASIAILVSGRDHLREIAPALRAAGLTPGAVEIERLDHRPVVRDLEALTRAMLHRADRTAWFAVLRAPWCGLRLADLLALEEEGGRTRCIPALLSETAVLARLSSDGRERVARLRTALEPVLAEAGRTPLRRWVETAWRRLGGPACLDNAGDIANAGSFFALLDTLEVNGALEDPLVVADKLSQLFALPDPAADRQLVLMTIHKAKGLEFDTVILPGLHRVGGQEDKPLLRWLEWPGPGGKMELIMAPRPAADSREDLLYDYLHDLEKRRLQLEQTRLLYVAVTRARRRLHLVACARTRESDDGLVVMAPAQRSLLASLWPVVAAYFDRALAEKPAPSREPAVTVPPVSSGLARLPLAWAPPAPVTGVSVGRRTTQRHIISEEPVSFDWAGQTARYLGTVVHQALQHLGRGNGAGEANLKVMLRARLRETGVRSGDLEPSAKLALQAVEQTWEDPRGRWILSSGHIDAQSELALTGIEDGEIYGSVLDRTFVDENGVRWIIDFKVGVHLGKDREAFFDQETERYREQLARYARLISNFDPRPVRAALYFPLYAGWREWDPFER